MPAFEQNRSIGPKPVLGVLDRGEESASTATSAVIPRAASAEFCGDDLHTVGIAVDDDHAPRALGDEPATQRTSDAAGPAGDDRDLVVQLHVVNVLRLPSGSDGGTHRRVDRGQRSGPHGSGMSTGTSTPAST